MSYAEKAIELKEKVSEAVRSHAGYDDLEKFVNPIEELCKEILINELMLNQDIYKALTTIRKTLGEGGENFEYEYDMPFFAKCLKVFATPSAIIFLGLQKNVENNIRDEDAENKIIEINGIEYKTIEAYQLYSEKENELEALAYSIMIGGPQNKEILEI